MSQHSSDVLTNIYNFILIDIIQILLIFLNHLKYIEKNFMLKLRHDLLICLFLTEITEPPAGCISSPPRTS